MASVELSRRVENVVGYPPLAELGELQRREFHEALLEAATFRGSAWQVAGGDPKGRAEPAGAARRYERLGRLALGTRCLKVEQAFVDQSDRSSGRVVQNLTERSQVLHE